MAKSKAGKVEIVGTCSSAESDMELDKRTYLPGIVAKITCPKCGTTYEKDMEEDYLSYPKVGVPIDMGGYCRNEKCEHEFPVMVVLRLTLEPA